MSCTICAGDEAEGWNICRRDLDRIDGDLEHIAECAHDAGAASTPTKGTGVACEEIKLPISADALDASLGLTLVPIGTERVQLLEVLEQWIRLVREEASLAPYGAATEGQQVTVGTSVAFLRSWLLWAVERPDFPMDDLAAEVKLCRNAIAKYHHDHGAADDLTRLACPSAHPDGDGRLCHARIAYDRHRPRNDMHCTRCGTTWTPGSLLLHALSDDTQTIWAYPADIQALVGVPKRTLQDWAMRGLVPRDGTRYDIGVTFRTRLRQTA
jgi:hypothetical protein